MFNRTHKGGNETMPDKPKRTVFLKAVPKSFLSDVPGSDQKSLRLPREGGISIHVDGDNIFQDADSTGQVVPGYVNVRLGSPDAQFDAMTAGPSGETVAKTARELYDAWSLAKAEYQAQRGQRIYLSNVPASMIRETSVHTREGDGRHLMAVSVPDYASAPANLSLAGRTPGYGMFMVHPDAIQPAGNPKDRDKGRQNVYVGRANEIIKSYRIRTPDMDENGTPICVHARRTAKDILDQYEESIQNFRNNKKQPDVVLRIVHEDSIRSYGGSRSFVQLNDHVAISVDNDWIRPSANGNRDRIPHAYDVHLPAGQEDEINIYGLNQDVDLVYQLQTTRSPRQTLRSYFQENRRRVCTEALALQGPGDPVCLYDVPRDNVRINGRNRNLLDITVPDVESADGRAVFQIPKATLLDKEQTIDDLPEVIPAVNIGRAREIIDTYQVEPFGASFRTAGDIGSTYSRIPVSPEYDPVRNHEPDLAEGDSLLLVSEDFYNQRERRKGSRGVEINAPEPGPYFTHHTRDDEPSL